MPKFLMVVVVICGFAGQVHAEMDEVQTPAEMVTCMKNYIENWIVAPDRIRSWEHQPAYTFAGSYFHASWHTRVMMDFGSFTMMAGPKSPVYCKYQTYATGTPDWNSGTCKATIQNGDVEFELHSFDRNGREATTVRKVASISQGKIFCYNIARP